MRPLALSILLTFLLLGVLTSCAQPAAPSPSAPVDAEAPAVDATALTEPDPTQAEASSSWQKLREIEIKHRTTVAGFLNDQYGLTAGYGGEVHYSTDGGESWPRAANKSACRFGLDIVDDKLAWTVGNNGNVRVSTDGGETWQAVTNLRSPSYFISFVDAQTGWAANRYTVWATHDGGQTWIGMTKPEGIANLVDVSLATAKDGYLLDKSGSLYITHDGGQTWSTESLGFTDIPLADMAHGAAIRFFDNTHGIIAAALAGNGQSQLVVMQTKDGGKTWETEELPEAIGSLFLSHDGTTLTVTETTGASMVVLSNPTVQQFALSNP